jgi:nitrilase
MQDFDATLVQLQADHDPPASLARAVAAVEAALCANPRPALIVLPEGFAGFAPLPQRRSFAVDPRVRDPLAAAAMPASDPAWGALAPLLPASHRAVIVAGGTPELAPDGRVYNTAFVLHEGRVLGGYRKIHRFDVDLPGGVTLRESSDTAAGEQPVVVELPFARLGLSICYDVRFPELYRALVDRDAEVLLVPAAFTAVTGPPHWEPLLRARAIESQCWVLAPAQVGDHGGGRRSHGHTLAIDPWGTVVAQRGRGTGLVHVAVEAAALAAARAQLPSLAHRRLGRTPAPDLGS